MASPKPLTVFFFPCIRWLWARGQGSPLPVPHCCEAPVPGHTCLTLLSLLCHQGSRGADMSPSHLSPSQGGSAAPAPTEEIWVLRKPFTGTVGISLPVPGAARIAAPRCPHAWTQSPDGISSPYAGGDRSSLGSTGSVASARSSGSGQSTGSGAHALHAGSEGVKVRPCTGTQ